ncbi:hypothetical protein ACFTAO_40045 [Paenibacillus rhizoplanae]
MSPIGHIQPVQTIVDEDLFQYKNIMGCRRTSEKRYSR